MPKHTVGCQSATGAACLRRGIASLADVGEVARAEREVLER